MRIAVDEGRRQRPQCARSRPLPRSHAPPPAWPPSGGQAGEPHPSSSAIDCAANKHVKPRNQHYRHLNAGPHQRSHGDCRLAGTRRRDVSRGRIRTTVAAAPNICRMPRGREIESELTRQTAREEAHVEISERNLLEFGHPSRQLERIARRHSLRHVANQDPRFVKFCHPPN